MATADISALYQEFTEALIEIWRRIRLALLGADGFQGARRCRKAFQVF